MQIDPFLEKEFQNLIQTGSSFTKESLIELKKQIKKKATLNYDHALEQSIEKLEEETKSFLKTGAVRGISTSLAFDSTYINIFGGKSIHGQNIDNKTLFDVASITKSYTVLLALLLRKNGILNFQNDVRERCPFFENLGNYTIEDLLYMRGEIRTRKRIEEARSLQEAQNILKTLYVHDSTKERFVYTDMGMIALSKVIEAEIKRKISISLGFADIMRLFLLEPLQLHHTTFFPKKNIAGNGREDHFVNDPKARTLGGPIGSAGLFLNNKDLCTLAQELFKTNTILKDLELLTTPIPNCNKGIGGLYQKYPDFSKTYVPFEYSFKTFASEGTTGSVAIFDQYNHIHNAFLVDSIDPKTHKKPDTFKEAYNIYQKKVTDLTLELHLLQKYHQESTVKEYVLGM